MSTFEKVGGQNTGRPLHFKKYVEMFPCPPTDLYMYVHGETHRLQQWQA